MLVPEALAYASIAGVSPVVGLYAAPGALILYARMRRSTISPAGSAYGFVNTLPDPGGGGAEKRDTGTCAACAAVDGVLNGLLPLAAKAGWSVLGRPPSVPVTS